MLQIYAPELIEPSVKLIFKALNGSRDPCGAIALAANGVRSEGHFTRLKECIAENEMLFEEVDVADIPHRFYTFDRPENLSLLRITLMGQEPSLS